MFISKLAMIPSARYHPPLIRPYEVQMDRYKQNDLTHYTQNGSQINPKTLAHVAGQILIPTSIGEREATIANGWQEPRMQFMMEIQHTSMDGHPELQYITGYTDYVGVNLVSGSIDSNMRMYLNTSVSTRTTFLSTHHGNMPVTRLRTASHVMGSSQATPIHQAMQAGKFALRPTDLATAISLSVEEAEGFDCGAMYGVGPSSSGLHLKTSRLNNGLANRYMSDICKAYNNAINEGSASKDYSAILSETAGIVREESISRNHFINELLKKGTSLSESDYFTYGELCQLFPETFTNTSIFKTDTPQNVSSGHMNHFGLGGSDFINYTNDFNTPSYQTTAAMILSNALPGLMMELMLTNVSFTATNKTQTGQGDIYVQGFGSFASVALEPFVERFKENFLFELWPALSKNNEIDLAINVQFNIVSHSSIIIEWGSEPPVHFAIPTFTDNLFVPVLTTKPDHAKTMSTDFSNVLDTIQTAEPGEYGFNQPFQSQGGDHVLNDLSQDQSQFNPAYSLF